MPLQKLLQVRTVHSAPGTPASTLNTGLDLSCDDFLLREPPPPAELCNFGRWLVLVVREDTVAPCAHILC